MPIQLIITGEHATDLFAEIQNFATALNGTAPKNVAGVTGSMTPAPSTPAPSTPAPEPTATTPSVGTDAKKVLSRKEQDDAVKYMINQGEKDDRFELLTKSRQTEVEAAIAKLAAPKLDVATTDADVDNMFDDDIAPVITVTREQVSALMAKIGKDKDGSPIQPRLLKIREILVDNIPEGQEIKVKNLPEDKLVTVYALIEEVSKIAYED